MTKSILHGRIIDVAISEPIQIPRRNLHNYFDELQRVRNGDVIMMLQVQFKLRVLHYVFIANYMTA